MQNSFFSVIIATYNREATLVEAITSLINQTEEDWEAIIIDDGSIDNSYFKIEGLLEKYPDKIRYFKQENEGTVSAKNRGISKCKGKYITFLDSDDLYEINHLQTRRELLENNPGIDLLHGGYRVIGSSYVVDRNNYQNKIHLSDCIIGGTFFIKPEVVRAVKGFKPLPIGTDSDLYDRLEKNGAEIMKTDIPTYIYRRESEDSITYNFQKSIKSN